MLTKFTPLFKRHEKFIPFLLFLLFLAVSIPGVNWGVPALWNPDELVWRVDMALGNEMVFDETEPDFNYPSLPKYLMFGVGKIVYGLGYSSADFIVAARLLSATLGALGAVLVYYLTRSIGAKVSTSALAGLFYITSDVIPANSRFAHNDLYLLFFSILCVYGSIKYQFTKSRIWIYGSFIAVGMAASSKYTGGSLLLVPIFTLIFMNWNELKRDWLRSIEILFIGAALTFGGYALGTPKAILWMAYYFKRMIPALQNYPRYGANSGTPIGLFGQWDVFRSAVGDFAYYIFILSVIWFVIKLVLSKTGRIQVDANQAQSLPILLGVLLIFDAPFLISINYIPRHFIPFVPFFSILGALFIAEIYDFIKSRQIKYASAVLAILLAVGLSYSFLRLASTALLFMNDARMPASEYIARLPGQNKRIEYTLYPPNIDRKQFAAATNYPIYFIKYPGEAAPTGGKIVYNQGEMGLIDRNVDYLVIDTFTYSRLYTKSICDTNPVECDFFVRLLAGKVTTFRLIQEFTYTLPPYLPQLSISAVNPEIRIYERVR